MWKLTIEDDEGKQTQLPLAHDEYGVGRAESNAIRLTDRNVSRNHATLKKNGQGWILKDLQSYNGTYVNGVPRRRRAAGRAAATSSSSATTASSCSTRALAPASPRRRAPRRRPSRPSTSGPTAWSSSSAPRRAPSTRSTRSTSPSAAPRTRPSRSTTARSAASTPSSSRWATAASRSSTRPAPTASASTASSSSAASSRRATRSSSATCACASSGAGKIFRADMTQNLPAVAGFDMSRSVAGGNARSGVGKLIGVGAAVGAGGHHRHRSPSWSRTPGDSRRRPRQDARRHQGERQAGRRGPQAPRRQGRRGRPQEAPRDPRGQAPHRRPRASRRSRPPGPTRSSSRSTTRPTRPRRRPSSSTSPPPTPSTPSPAPAPCRDDRRDRGQGAAPRRHRRPASMGTFVPGTAAAPPPRRRAHRRRPPSPPRGRPNEDADPQAAGAQGLGRPAPRSTTSACSRPSARTLGDHACRNRASEMLKKKTEGN